MKIYVDSNLAIQLGKPPGGAVATRLIDMVAAGFVQVVTTDHSILEVAKVHANNDWKAIGHVASPHARELIQEHLGVEITPDQVVDLLPRLVEKYTLAVSEMFESMGATILSLDDVAPSSILSDLSLIHI